MARVGPLSCSQSCEENSIFFLENARPLLEPSESARIRANKRPAKVSVLQPKQSIGHASRRRANNGNCLPRLECGPISALQQSKARAVTCEEESFCKRSEKRPAGERAERQQEARLDASNPFWTRRKCPCLECKRRQEETKSGCGGGGDQDSKWPIVDRPVGRVRCLWPAQLAIIISLAGGLLSERVSLLPSCGASALFIRPANRFAPTFCNRSLSLPASILFCCLSAIVVVDETTAAASASVRARRAKCDKRARRSLGTEQEASSQAEQKQRRQKATVASWQRQASERASKQTVVASHRRPSSASHWANFDELNRLFVGAPSETCAGAAAAAHHFRAQTAAIVSTLACSLASLVAELR